MYAERDFYDDQSLLYARYLDDINPEIYGTRKSRRVTNGKVAYEIKSWTLANSDKQTEAGES